jgi:hypothetical protein
MPDIVGVPGDTNTTSVSSNITSAASTLITSLLSAAGAIGIAKLASSQGQAVVATGNPLNPVQVVTPGTSASQALSQNFGLIVLGLGAALILVMGAAALSHRR